MACGKRSSAERQTLLMAPPAIGAVPGSGHREGSRCEAAPGLLEDGRASLPDQGSAGCRLTRSEDTAPHQSDRWWPLERDTRTPRLHIIAFREN